MAVTENMLIDIQVKSGNAEKNINQIAKEVNELSSNSNKLTDSMKLLEKQTQTLTQTFSSISLEFQKTSRVISSPSLKDSIKQTDETLVKAGRTVKDLGVKTKETTKEINKDFKEVQTSGKYFGDSFKSMAGNVTAFGASIGVVSFIAYISSLDKTRTALLKLNEIFATSNFAAVRNMQSMAAGIAGPLDGIIKGINRVGNQAIPQAMNSVLGFTKAYLSSFKSLEIVDLVSIMSPGLLLIGNKLEESENKFVSWTGTVMRWAGILSAGILAVAGAVTFGLGMISTAIGESLIKSMDEATAKFIKFEAVMSQFKFTLLGFSRTYGKEAVGTLDYWNETLTKVYKNTVFTREEIAKSIKLLIAEGRIIGLTTEQNTELLKRTADVAAATGRDLYETTQMVINGLTNNADAVLSLGIDIRNTSLAHSEYAQSTGIALEQMTMQELAMARLNALYERTTPLIGAAENQTKTIVGSNMIYEKSINDISVAIGETSNLTRAYLSWMNKFYAMINSVPAPLLSMYGNLKDIAGVTFIVIGQLLKLITVMLAFLTVLKLLNVALSYFAGISLSIGSMVSFIVTRLVPYVALLLVIGKAIQELNDESYGFKKTMEELADTFGLLSKKSDDVAESVGIISKSVSFLAKVIVNSVKVPLTGIIQLINYLAKSFVLLNNLITTDKEKLEIYDYQLQELDIRLASLAQSSNQSYRELGLLGSGTAYASEQTSKFSEEIINNNSLVDKFKDRVKKLAKEINSGFDIGIERQKILGNDFERAIAEYKQAQKELENVFKMKSSDREIAQKYADAERRALTASLDVEKLRLDTMKKINELSQNLGIEVMRAQGRSIAAIKIERDLQLKSIDEQISGMKLLGEFREDDLRALEKTRKLIMKTADIKIEDERAKFTEKTMVAEKLLSDIKKDVSVSEGNAINELIQKQRDRFAEIDKMEKDLRKSNDYGVKARIALDKARGEALKIVVEGQARLEKENLKEIEKKNYDLQTSIDQATQTQIYNINRKYDAEMDVLEVQEKQLRSKGELTKAIEESIAAARGKLTEQKSIELKTAPGENYDKLAMIGKDVAGSITQSFTEGATGMVAGAASIVSMVIEAIDVVLTAIPGFIDKVSQIFDKITNFPKVLFAAFDTLGRSITNFVENIGPQLAKFIPMIIESIVDLLIKLPDIMVAAIEKLPDLLIGMLDKIEILIPKLITGLIRAIPSIAKLFIFHLLQPYIWWTVAVMLTKAIINGLVESVNQIFSGAVMKMPDTKKFATELADGVKAATKTLSGETSKLFAVMSLDSAAKAEDKATAAGKAVEAGFKAGVDYLTLWWRKLWAWIAELWQGLMDAWKILWNWITQIWDLMVLLFRALWDNIKVLWDDMVAIFRAVWDVIVVIWYQLVDAFKAVWDGIVAVWYVIVDYFKLIWDGIIGIFRNVVDAFGGFLENLVTGLSGIGQFIIDGLVAAIAGAGDIFSGIGTTIWEGLKSALSGIGSFLTGIFDTLNPVNLFEKIFKVDSKGQGTVEKALGIDIPFANFAMGGLVGGQAKIKGDSSLNDRVLALLSPGEAIIPRSLMDDKATRAIIEAVLSGKINPNKYWGGSFKVGGTSVSISNKGVQINDKPAGDILPKNINDVLEPLTGLWKEVEKQTYDMVMKMFESNKLHGGGLVGFANGGDVPAMLQSGEFVINKKSAGTLGGDLLNRLNSGKIGETTQNMTFNIDIKTTEPIDDAFFRNRLMPKIKDEFKRASLDGQFVISKRGIG